MVGVKNVFVEWIKKYSLTDWAVLGQWTYGLSVTESSTFEFKRRTTTSPDCRAKAVGSFPRHGWFRNLRVTSLVGDTHQKVKIEKPGQGLDRVIKYRSSLVQISNWSFLLGIHFCLKNYLKLGGLKQHRVLFYSSVGQKADMESHWVKIKVSARLYSVLDAVGHICFEITHIPWFMAPFFCHQSQLCCICLTIFP